MDLIAKLASIQDRYEEVGRLITQPDLVNDMKKFTQLTKEYKDLEDIVKAFHAYRDVLSNIDNNKEILETEKDEEFRDMAKAELDDLRQQQERMEDEIKTLLIPKDPEDGKNVILEIRAGTGGDEASIFAGDLLKMYLKYCEGRGWKTEIQSQNPGTVDGYKEVIVQVSGSSVYGDMKFESGVHRVQRVPKTESQGRVHTSAASVAVLPEVDEVDVDINPADLKIDTFRASGAGGQHVNKTESAVRITHIPSGVVVECQEGRSQLRNREIAMGWLRSRLYDAAQAEQKADIASKRKTLVSTGDRSAKIRTYNYPQGRVTDHRINLTLYNLDAIVGGDLQEIIDALRVAENAEKLKEGNLV